MRRRQSTGFTLIEMTVAMAIVGILAAIGMGSLVNMRKRGSFASGTGDLIVGLRKTRANSFGRGTTTVFVIDTAGARFWGIEDLNGTFDITTFDPSNPAPAGYNLITSGTLPTGVTFTGASNGYGAALPQPYAGVPAVAGGGNPPNYPYCSFCRTAGPNLAFGSIQFDPSGGARFNSGPATVGQSFSVAGATLQTLMTFAVIGRTGSAETFSPY
jgi:prepilin-type N-terminal cleavage/methylation domain-containing protein